MLAIGNKVTERVTRPLIDYSGVSHAFQLPDWRSRAKYKIPESTATRVSISFKIDPLLGRRKALAAKIDY